MKKLLFKVPLFGVLFFLCSSPSLFAQKEGYVWAFPDSSGIDFNDLNNPRFKTDIILSTSYPSNGEANAVISTSSGKFLMYLNSRKRRSCLLNEHGDTIQNSYLIKADETNTNGAVILPIKEGKEYILITLYGDSMFYNLIIKKNNNFIIEKKNIYFYKNSIDHLAEKFACTRHANGRDWWMLAHSVGDKNRFFKFFLSGSTLQYVGFQDIGSSYQQRLSDWGEMCFSPTGTKLCAVTKGGVIDVFDFDRCTGILSNTWMTGYPNYTFDPVNSNYGCSFSLNEKFFYVSTQSILYQFNLENQSKKILYNKPLTPTAENFGFGQHELGPNGKIYICHLAFENRILTEEAKSLGIIHYPDSLGDACKYEHLGFSLQGKATQMGLPHLPNFALEPENLTLDFEKLHTICQGENIAIGPQTGNPDYRYEWQPAASLSDNLILRPVAFPRETTTYTLTASRPGATGACDSAFFFVTVTVDGPKTKADAGKYRAICAGEKTRLGGKKSEENLIYRWKPDVGLSNPDITGPYAAPAVTTTYTLTITDPAVPPPCNYSIDTVTVQVNPTDFDAGFRDSPDYFVTRPYTKRFTNITPQAGKYNFVWAFVPRDSAFTQHAEYTFVDTGRYVVKLLAIDKNTHCVDTVSQEVFVRLKPNGIEGIPSSEAFRLYPNPMRNTITIEYHAPPVEKAEIEIENVLGVKVASFSLDPHNLRTEIDVTSLPSGVYVCRLVIGKERKGAVKLVKN